jgi:hypothetical protein
MEDSTLPSVGASFKKWGCCAHTPKAAQALATCKGLKKVKKISSKKLFF